jgi:alanyl-tRNA synthetase
LQKALRTVLGDHVEQKGSLVTPTRLRFDFAHFQAMTADEIAKVEAMVNEQIAADLAVITAEMTVEEAKKSGAMALFGEKYGDTVRVVTMGDFSKELCGGTHVSHTGVITTFKILSESGIAAGVRRVEAITGVNVLAYYAELESRMSNIAALLKAKDSEIEDKIAALTAQVKALSSENESLKNKLAQSALGDVMSQVQEIKGVKVLATRVPGLDAGGLRELGDQLRDKIGSGVVVLVTTTEDKVSILAVATADAVAKGAHAGNIVKTIAAVCDGKGGGRPDSAMAGGKDVSKADAVVAAVADTVAAMIKD